MNKTLPFSQPKVLDVEQMTGYEEYLRRNVYVEQRARPLITIDQHSEVPGPQVPIARIYIGIEFEGMIRAEVYDQFRASMADLAHDDEGNQLIQFGSDGSIKNVPAGFHAVEIRTEKMKLRTGVRVFDDMLSFLYLASEVGDFVTNQTCGLHLNVSERILFEAERQADFYCHILTSFDEAGILERFGRTGNKYCLPFAKENRAFEDIRHQYQLLKRRERAAADRGDDKWKVNEGKYLAVSLRGNPTHSNYDGPEENNQRVEFRCVGNADYHLRFNDLDYALNHMLKCVRAAHRAMI